MKTRMNFKDEFYQKLKLLVLPIAIQNFMLALVSATDAIMLGWIDQTSLSAVSLAGQVQFVLNLFITGIAAGAGIMAAQYWGKRDAASIEKVIPIALRANLLFSGLFKFYLDLTDAFTHDLSPQSGSTATRESRLVRSGLFYGSNRHLTLCCRCCYSDYLLVQNTHLHQVSMVPLQYLDSP